MHARRIWQRRLRGLGRLALGLAIAALVHLVAWHALRGRFAGDAPLPAVAEAGTALPLVANAEPVMAVQLAPSAAAHIPEIPLSALRGGADEVGAAQTHPLPDQRVELPGPRAASAGGGAAAGEPAFSHRRDRADDAALRHEVWNGKRDYQSEHERTARAAQSPEAIHQATVRGEADRARALAAASAGTAVRAPGDEAAAHGGAVRVQPAAPLVDPGPARADVPVHGPTPRDDANSAAASSAPRPGPYEITPASAGGAAPTGVAGPTAPGQLAGARGASTAATTQSVARGPRDLTITADAQDPYVRQLFARLARAVAYPRELALDLRSGRPVAQLVLHADGAVTGLAIAVPARDAGFDRELLRALASLGKLPPPPARLLDGQPAIRVRVEWVFDPGILR